MAIIKGTFGTNLRKRVGQVVYRNRQGVNVASARPASVKNPRTEAQMKQRMIFTTVQAAYKVTRDITDHSIEGVSYGAKTMAMFMKDNLNILRKTYGDQAFCFKGNSNVVMPNEFQISKGSLPSITHKLVKQLIVNDNSDINFPALLEGTVTTETTVKEFLDLLGISKGDQLSFVFVQASGKATSGDISQLANGVLRSRRFCIATTADDAALIFKLGTAGRYQFDESLLYNYDEVEALQFVKDGATSALKSFGIYEGKSSVDINCGCAIIVSRLSNSSWMRSTETLWGMCTVDLDNSNGAIALQTYNPASNYFLNNATV